MSRNYKFHNPQGMYFVSFAVVFWIDVFSKDEYKDIFLDSLRYSQQNKGMEIYAWCIMPNHVHLIYRSIDSYKPELILGDLKRFTSRKIVSAIKENPDESRKDWLLRQFGKAAEKSTNVKHHQFWRHDNKPIELWSNRVILRYIRYTHNNPVKKGLVQNPEDYLYSSAKDYAGEIGILENIVIVDI